MLFEIDPLTDPRWLELLGKRPLASAFHTRGWLEALYKTYDYKPAALAVAAPDGELLSSLVFCRVQSRLTGRRLISLPFSDHCEPLLDREEDLSDLTTAFDELAKTENCKYAELRHASNLPSVRSQCELPSFYLHRLDLRPGTAAVFRHFHRNCIQRRIRHAETEGMTVEQGSDPDTVKRFYTLLLQTRRRHGLPPQPIEWFRNLMDCMGQAATIRFACKAGQPVAAILTMQHGKTLYYKYGASEARFHSLGAMPYLFWHAIQDGIDRGLHELDMGRSACDNPGLITFKERWHATRYNLFYSRLSERAPGRSYSDMWGSSLARMACQYMPDRCLVRLGKLLYPHID